MAMESSDLEQLLDARDAPAPSPRWSGAWLLGLGVSLAVVAVLSVKQGRLGKLGDFAQTVEKWAVVCFYSVSECIHMYSISSLN
jgi:hypothetical protein